MHHFKLSHWSHTAHLKPHISLSTMLDKELKAGKKEICQWLPHIMSTDG